MEEGTMTAAKSLYPEIVKGREVRFVQPQKKKPKQHEAIEWPPILKLLAIHIIFV